MRLIMMQVKQLLGTGFLLMGLIALPVLAQEATPEATPELTPEATVGAPCFVRTDEANVVSVRVGPGLNRTAFVFLPAKTDFEVLGKAEADDGSLWWKLDRTVVAPRKSAAEAWVSQEDVETSGGCEAVIDVNAPPIIPISAPVNEPETTAEPGGAPADTEEAITPQAGTWTIVYPNSVSGTCAKGSKTATLDLNWPPESWTLSVGSGSLTYAGKVFVRSAGSVNSYSGQTQITRLGDTPVPARFTLRVTSETAIAATLSFSYTVGDAACSFTVRAAMSRG
jgi:hypothetical protein